MIKASTTSCIRSAIDLELQAAALYTGLAERFAAQAWLRDLLLGLAAEEEQHAMRVRMLERIQVGVPWRPEVLQKLCADVQRAIDEIRDFQVAFAGPFPIEPEEVLEAILRIERSFVGLHAEMMSSSASPAVSQVFRSLSAQDAHHRALIAGAGERIAAERAAGGAGSVPGR
jgi:rubrerythrin